MAQQTIEDRLATSQLLRLLGVVPDLGVGVKCEGAGIGGNLAEQHVDQRCFPHPVGTGDAQPQAGVHLHVQMLEQPFIIVLLGQVLDAQGCAAEFRARVNGQLERLLGLGPFGLESAGRHLPLEPLAPTLGLTAALAVNVLFDERPLLGDVGGVLLRLTLLSQRAAGLGLDVIRVVAGE